MEKIWIEVDGLQLHTFVRGRRERTVWSQLKVGSKGFNFDGLFFEQGNNGSITQNWALANVRFLDRSVFHPNPVSEESLLEGILAKAICDLYLRGAEKNKFERVLLDGELGLEFPFFKPESWGDSILRIPVEFVKLRRFSTYGLWSASVYVQVGHHLILYAHVFDGSSQVPRYKGEEIQDERVLSVINSLLAREDVVKYIRYLIENRITGDLGKVEFVDSIAGCKIDGVPPAVGFFRPAA